VSPQSRLRTRLIATGIALVFAGLPLAGCKEVEEESAAGYEPSKVEPVKGAKEDDLVRIKFTKEGAARTGLKTERVRGAGEHTVIPYAALIYNDEAKTFVYTSPKPLSFVRAAVKVDRIEGSRVLLSEGPPAGTKIVTVGATEVYGTEIDMAGSH
jgi:hypothetical protein